MDKVRVVIADDNISIRTQLRAMLDVKNIEIEGREAIKLISRLNPNIITMDIDMPIMDGVQAIEFIMATTPVPILVITSTSGSGPAYKALSMGALEVISNDEALMG